MRPATAEDLPILQELNEALRAELAGQRGGELWLRTHPPRRRGDDDLHDLLVDDGALVLAGCLDRSVVGYALARLRTFHPATILCELSELFVLRDAREVGLGEALLDAVVGWAVDRGCTGVDATALPGSRATKNFFEGQGFVARSLVMHRPLQAPAALAGASSEPDHEPPV